MAEGSPYLISLEKKTHTAVLEREARGSKGLCKAGGHFPPPALPLPPHALGRPREFLQATRRSGGFTLGCAPGAPGSLQPNSDLFSCNEKQRAGERAWNALGCVSGSFFPLRSLLDACHSAERLPHSVTHSPPLPTPNTPGAAAAASSLQVLPSQQAWQQGLS